MRFGACPRASAEGAALGAKEGFAHEPHAPHERAVLRAAGLTGCVVFDVCVVCGPKILLSTDHTDHTDGRIFLEVRV